MKLKIITALSLSLLISACSQTPKPSSDSSANQSWEEPNKGRYSQDKDSHPTRLPTLLEMTDPEPKAELLSRGGNKPYNIYGVDYSPLVGITEYDEVGIASWYGNKFHGHKTSNGEEYNVFAMSAAHKTLPLPSYVRVTNLDTNQSAIVRVNDRGPFHNDRIIDLSYSAAYKIGMMGKGTARVRVELLASPAMAGQDTYAMGLGSPSRNKFEETTLVSNPATPRPGLSQPLPAAVAAPTAPAYQAAPAVARAGKVSGCYIQLVASGNKARLQQLGEQISQRHAVATEINDGNGIFRLLAGPMTSAAAAGALLDQLKSADYPSAYITDRNSCS
ncbi:septal ring lytic transglycosylase RlpA family protein [Rheinheimera sp.]|uniref:septal ring lytic transglycosylase RlpA family protein n=1 Tax=Rheinheimera sp. TaxID=1869214 RepID=UPI00307D4FFA